MGQGNTAFVVFNSVAVELYLMREVKSTTMHKFGDGLLVEIIGLDESGEISTETIELEVVDPHQGRVEPRGEIPPEYEEQVHGTLSENGYSIFKK